MRLHMDLTLGIPVLRLDATDGNPAVDDSVMALAMRLPRPADSPYILLSDSDVGFIMRSLTLFGPERYREAIEAADKEYYG